MKCCSLPSYVLVRLLALLTCLAGPTWGQTRLAPPVDPATHRITYTAVVPVSGARQAELLLRARACAQRLGSATRLLVATRRDGSEEVRAGSVRPFVYLENGKAHVLSLHFTTRIVVRAGSYTYDLTDFDFVYPVNAQQKTPRLAAETFYTGRTKANHESFTKWLVTMRICFDEAALEVLVQLQEEMSKPASQTEGK